MTSTTMKGEMMKTLIILDSGEQLESGEENNEGVMTDAGLIPWEWIQAFKTFNKPTQQWMSIPLS